MKKSPLVIAGGQTSQLQTGDWIGPKNNSALIAPAVSNDDTQGYEVQSRWTDTALGKEYVCVDATTGAAVWVETTGGGGGGFSGYTEVVLDVSTGNVDSISCGVQPQAVVAFVNTVVVEGIAAGANGKRVILKKVGAGTATIKNNGSATPADNIGNNSGADIVLNAGEAIELLYVAAGPFWVHVSSALVPSGGGGGAEHFVIFDIAATPSGSVYNDLGLALTALAAVESPKNLLIRKAGVLQTVTVPKGTYDLSGLVLTSDESSILPVLSFADGSTLSGMPRVIQGVLIEGNNDVISAAPLYTVSGFALAVLKDGAIRNSTTATQPVISVPSGSSFSLSADTGHPPLYKNGGGSEPVFIEGTFSFDIWRIPESSFFGDSNIFTNANSGIGQLNINTRVLIPGGYTRTDANFTPSSLNINHRYEQRVQELITASALPATILYVNSAAATSGNSYNSLSGALAYANSVPGRKIIYILQIPGSPLAATAYDFNECELYNRAPVESAPYPEVVLQFADGATVVNFPMKTDVKFVFQNTVVPVCSAPPKPFEFSGISSLRNIGTQPIISLSGTQDVKITLKDEAYMEAVGGAGVLALSGTATLRLYAYDYAQLVTGWMTTSGAETEFVVLRDFTLRPGGLNNAFVDAILSVVTKKETRVNELITARNLAATITTPTRALNTTYTNGSKPRAVSVSVQLPFSAAAESAQANLNFAGNLLQIVRAPRVTLTGFDSNSNPTNPIYSMFGIVPPGSNYQVTDVGSTGGLVPVILAWYEQELSL